MNIGASVVIKGNITAAEDLAITGRVEGDIRLDAGELMLAAGSHVVGDIVVPSAVVHGNIQGSLTASERVHVRPGASVSGSVSAPTLIVADGAQMNCRVEMPAIVRPHLAQPAVPPKLPVAV
jgi:cytoskeletal protein CcmA (bactofilin family)